ncbi:MAG: cytochrome c oxidase subunit I [Thermoplasmatota archaeon]
MEENGHGHGEVSGLKGWLFTTDHKRIGLMYMFSAFFFFMLAGIAALIVRAHLATPTCGAAFTTDPASCSDAGAALSTKTFNEIFSAHGTTMVFFWIIPVLTGGFGNYFLPLCIGAKDMAFPRLNALSYWVYISAGIIAWFGFLIGQQAALGWTGYAPLSEKVGLGADHGPDFWLLAVHLVGISSMMGAINFIVTVMRERAPGVTFDNMSLFVWAQLVTAFLIVFATPFIGTAMVLLYFDRNLGTSFFLTNSTVAGAGGDTLLYQNLFWFYSHPAVYVMILPAMGIVSEVIPRMTGRPIFGYKALAYSIVAIGFLGFTVWMHHMFATGVDIRIRLSFMLMTLVIAVPSGIKIFNWVASLWGGSLVFRAPLLFVLGFLTMFTIGGVDGAYMASIPVDYDLHMTYWVVSHIHYVLFGGSVLGVFAGIYYWFPRMSGRMYDEKLAQWHFWLTFIGLNVVFFTMHLLGMAGMPRRVYDYDPALTTLNFVTTVGAFILAFAQIFFAVNMLKSMRSGTPVKGDPWGGPVPLEWETFEPIPAEAPEVPVGAHGAGE